MCAENTEPGPPGNRDERAETQQLVRKRGRYGPRAGREASRLPGWPGRFYGEGAGGAEHGTEAAAPDAGAPRWSRPARRLGPGQGQGAGSELERPALRLALDGAALASPRSRLHVKRSANGTST